MYSTEQNTKTQTEFTFDERIKGMMYSLQLNTESFLNELNRSYELYKIDCKTDMAKHLEQIVLEAKPGKLENELLEKLLLTLNNIGKKVVIDGFLKKLDHVSNAYLLSESDNRVLYGVVPKNGKDDSLRLEISNFYSETSNWEVFKHTEPLFQVIPAELIGKVKTLQVVI